MTKFLTAMVLAGLTAAPLAALAEGSPVVVELFTSQGCSSCPPADEILSALAEDEDVLALALHVDYWDYIGWADSFAIPKFTNRQKQYAAQAGERTIYTPQFVVGGVDHVVGAHGMEIMNLVHRHQAMAGAITVSLVRDGDQMTLDALANQSFSQPLNVDVISYLPSAEVDIERGENAGRSMDYTNIVRSWDRLGQWDTSTPLTLNFAVETDNPVVVILQEPGPGLIVAAAQVD